MNMKLNVQLNKWFATTSGIHQVSEQQAIILQTNFLKLRDVTLIIKSLALKFVDNWLIYKHSLLLSFILYCYSIIIFEHHFEK